MNASTGTTPYVTQQAIRFGDVDPAGIVYFPKIYDLIHQVFEELWDRHVGKLYYHLLCEERMGFPLVHSEVDFKHPLKFGDRPVVRVSCFKLGTSSLGLRYVYEVGGEMCVDARMTTVCVQLDSLASTPIPDEHRRRFEHLREDG